MRRSLRFPRPATPPPPLRPRSAPRWFACTSICWPTPRPTRRRAPCPRSAREVRDPVVGLHHRVGEKQLSLDGADRENREAAAGRELAEPVGEVAFPLPAQPRDPMRGNIAASRRPRAAAAAGDSRPRPRRWGRPAARIRSSRGRVVQRGGLAGRAAAGAAACWRAMPRSVSATRGVFVGSARPAERRGGRDRRRRGLHRRQLPRLGPFGEVGGHLRRGGVERVGNAATLAPAPEPVPLRRVGRPRVVGQRGRGRRGDAGAGDVVERGQRGVRGRTDGSRRQTIRSAYTRPRRSTTTTPSTGPPPRRRKTRRTNIAGNAAVSSRSRRTTGPRGPTRRPT